MKSIKDRHVIGALIFISVLALNAGCAAEAEKERGKNIRRCLRSHTPQECAMLFPPPCPSNVEVEVGE